MRVIGFPVKWLLSPARVIGIAITVLVSAALFGSAADATPSTISLAIPANPSYWTQPTKLIATVTAGATGTVKFYPFEVVVPLSGNQAELSLPGLNGSYTVVAVYSGDAKFASSSSNVINWRILPARTAIALTSPVSGQVTDSRQLVTLTATVTVLPPAEAYPAGAVDFLDNGVVFETLLQNVLPTVANTGQATTPVFLSAGVHSLTARFRDNTSGPYPAFAGSQTTNSVTLTVKQATTTTISASPSQGVASQPVTLTATVTPSATGTVTFYRAANPAVFLGTASLRAGIAQMTITPATPMPVWAVYAVYPGDSSFGSSSSDATRITLSPATSGTTITQPAQGATYSVGQPVIITAAVTINPPAAAGPAGLITFLDNGVAIASTTVAPAGGQTAQASTTLASLPPGPHILTAQFTGSTGTDGLATQAFSTSPAVIISAKAAPVITLTSSASTLEWGQSVAVTAQLGSGATGSMSFIDSLDFPSGTTAAITNGQAQLTLSNLRVGQHLLSATYAGNSSYANATSGTIIVTVNPANTLTALISPATGSQLTAGATVTLSARVQAVTAALSPIGSVRFFDNSAAVGLAPLSSGAASITLTNLSPGTHAVVATFLPAADSRGDTDFATSTSSIVVFGASGIGSPAVLSSEPSSPAYGETLTFRLNLAAGLPAGTAPPAGQVTFQDGDTAIGTVTVDQGAASIQAQVLAAGTHLINAVHGGDSLWPASVTTLSLTIAEAATATTLATSTGSSGNALLVAKVARKAAGYGSPTGTVQFIDVTSQTAVGTAALSGGTASLNVGAELVMRSHAAAYSGGANFAGSTSSATPSLANAASYATTTLAPDAIGTMFGAGLFTGDSTAAPPLPTSLNGASMTLTDQTGTSYPVPLYGVFGSAGQVNFVVPAQAAPGLGVLKISSRTGGEVSSEVNVARLAPGIFTANGDGRGAPAGTFVKLSGGVRTTYAASVFDSTRKLWVPQAIDLGSDSDKVVLLLYGTGIRHRVEGGVSATMNGVNVPVLYSGEQSEFPGLDQLNLEVPHALAGAGTVELLVTVEGIHANAIVIEIR